MWEDETLGDSAETSNSWKPEGQADIHTVGGGGWGDSLKLKSLQVRRLNKHFQLSTETSEEPHLE